MEANNPVFDRGRSHMLSLGSLIEGMTGGSGGITKKGKSEAMVCGTSDELIVAMKTEPVNLGDRWEGKTRSM